MDQRTHLPKNAAAWALKPQQRPLVVSSAPYASPPENHVAIAVHCVAINPIDWILQDQDIFHLKYPAVLGTDVAGEVVEVGAGVTGFKVGDRVIANCNGYGAGASHGAFQKYTLVPAHAVAGIPDAMPLRQAVVLPLGISTASAGLYQKGYLALPLPSPSQSPTKLGRTVLIWGGSSSVGSCAIQLAAASGARVFTTASRANFLYCKHLGAAKLFDYHDADVEDQIVAALEGSTLAGVYHAVGADGAVQTCARIADRVEGKAIVVTVRGVPEDGIPGSVRVRAIASSDIFKPGSGVGEHIWGSFLSEALVRGAVVPKPDPVVVGSGLRSVQHGLDRQKAGVSARKVVVDGIEHDASTERREAEAEWLDSHCGVEIVLETWRCPCPLFCQKHTWHQKRAVRGRSAPFDQLLAQRRCQELSLRARRGRVGSG